MKIDVRILIADKIEYNLGRIRHLQKDELPYRYGLEQKDILDEIEELRAETENTLKYLIEDLQDYQGQLDRLF